jgi:ketosteroid isomerase-like protein
MRQVRTMLRLGSVWRSLLPAISRSTLALVASSAILVPASLTAAIGPPQAPGPRSPGELRDEWVNDLRSKQLDHILTLYAPNAVFLQPSGARVSGQAALRDLFKNVMGSFDSELTLHVVNTGASGNLVYEDGNYEETLVPLAGGPKIQMHATYLTVYRRQGDGTWRIVEHMWSGVEPTPPK